MQSRTEMLLESIDKTHNIIEIGPSHSPLTPKADGWNSKSIDHATKDALIEKYRTHPDVNLDRIEHVDFVWQSGRLSDAVPTALHGTFDVFLASHVIEHTPDLIGFLESAQTLLTPTGTVILAIPDKRFCYDYFRVLTGTFELIAAHREKRSRHIPKEIFEYTAYNATCNHAIAWGQHPIHTLALTHSLEEAYDIAMNAKTGDDSDYYDIHTWKFTPTSFQLRFLELARLGLTDWQIDRITPSVGCEFFVWLKPGGIAKAQAMSAKEFAALRLSLLKNILREEKEQADYLIAGEQPAPKPSLMQKAKALSYRILRLPFRITRKIVRELGLA